MPLIDMPLHELERYAPAREEPADFDEFWQRTLAEARQHPMEPTFTPADVKLRAVEVHDVTFPGFGGDPIKGWLLRPPGSPTRCRAWSATSGTAAGAACPTSGWSTPPPATPTS